MQAYPVETPDDNRLFFDFRPEWTRVQLGPDFNISVCTVSNRVLTTLTRGFPTSQDMDRYCDFMLGVMSEGLSPDQPYIHIMELSGLKGSTPDARNRFIKFLEKRALLRGAVVCGASAFMRMNIKLAQKHYRFSFPVWFAPDLDNGIHLAGGLLGLDFPDCFEWPSKFVTSSDKISAPRTHITVCEDTAGGDAAAFYRHELSKTHHLEFSWIGPRILFCRFKGSAPMPFLDPAQVLEARRQAIQRCMSSHGPHVEIWDGNNLRNLLGRLAIFRIFKALFGDPQTVLSFFILDLGCRIRSIVHLSLWCKPTPFPVRCLASLTKTILQAKEILQSSGIEEAEPPPMITAKYDWHSEDKAFGCVTEIWGQDIVHCLGSGQFKVGHVEQQMKIYRQLARKIHKSGRSYYLLTSGELFRDASYKTRKKYFLATSKLFRDYPFQTHVFYGAKGKTLAGLNLGKHQVAYRLMMAEDLSSALALIQADKLRRTYLNPRRSDADGGMRSPGTTVLKPYVDDILKYLATVSWEPAAMGRAPQTVDPEHPFAKVFDAVELIRDDIRMLFLEEQKAAREQLELEKQLERSQKMAALGLMAGGVAHDLNNVLSGLLTYPEVVLMDVPENSPLRKPLNVIRKSGEQAAAIVQDLLIMARRGVVQIERIKINTLIEEYLASPEHRSLTARFPLIRLDADLDENVMEINGSAPQLKKALMNLVSNAFEASPSTGGVTIRTENGFVQPGMDGFIREVEAGQYAVIEIVDRGDGIAEQDLPHIFEPFYTTKVMGRSGTGLGMAVIWGVIQDHKGYIDIQTRSGKGTTCTLFFPVCDNGNTDLKSKSQQAQPRGCGETILVVDDLDSQRQIAKSVIEHLGYRVETASSGEAALRYLENNATDLVVLDMVMGAGWDGLETTLRIREQNPRQKIIIATGYAENERLKQVQILSNGPVIEKPYTIETMRNALCTALKDQS